MRNGDEIWGLQLVTRNGEKNGDEKRRREIVRTWGDEKWRQESVTRNDNEKWQREMASKNGGDEQNKK